MRKLNNEWYDKHVEIIGLYSTPKEDEITKEKLKNRLNESFKDVLKDSKKQIKVITKDNTTKKG